MLVKRVDAEWKQRIFRTLSFNGKNSYVIPSKTEWNNYVAKYGRFTVFYRILPLKSLHSLNIVIYGNSNGGIMFGFQPNYSYIAVSFSAESGWGYDATAPSSIKLGDWNDYIISYDGDNLYIEENGVVKFDNSIGKRLIKTSDAIYIATGYIPYYKFYFHGYIALLKIWYDVLSKSEIKHLRKHPYDPINEDKLVLDLNPAGIDITNSKWWDLSKYKNNGTIYNATEVKLAESEVIVQ